MFVNFKRLLLTLYRLEEGQQEILSKLDGLSKSGENGVAGHSPQGEGGPGRGDEWISSGIDNILSYQVGKKGGKR